MFQTPHTRTGQAGHGGSEELKRAKLELVGLREQGDAHGLRALLERYPQHAAALIEFSAALTATDAYADVVPTPETTRIAAAARVAAFDAVFGAAPAFGSLKALRNARQLSLKAVADRLGLGLDVLSALESGRIRARSVPARFLGALGAILDATADQVGAILGAQVAPVPAYRRATGDGFDGQLDFAEAVQLSSSMSSQQRAQWLEA
jgi:transcriptional regulator with XRE-family HTH domain